MAATPRNVHIGELGKIAEGTREIMKPEIPFLLLSAAILFWGQQTGLWLAALPACFGGSAPSVAKIGSVDRDFARVSYVPLAGPSYLHLRFSDAGR